MQYFQKSFIGRFPLRPPRRYRHCPWRTVACLHLETGTLSSGTSGGLITGDHIFLKMKHLSVDLWNRNIEYQIEIIFILIHCKKIYLSESDNELNSIVWLWHANLGSIMANVLNEQIQELFSNKKSSNKWLKRCSSATPNAQHLGGLTPTLWLRRQE